MSKRDDAMIVAVLSQSDAANIAARIAKVLGHAIDDLATDAVIVTWRAAQFGCVDIAQLGHVRAYLFVLASRMASRWKKNRRFEVHREGADAEGPDPMPQFEARDERERIAELLHTDAARLLKAFGEGMSGSDIATQLTPVGTVYTRKRRAKKALGAGLVRDVAAERVLLHKPRASPAASSPASPRYLPPFADRAQPRTAGAPVRDCARTRRRSSPVPVPTHRQKENAWWTSPVHQAARNERKVTFATDGRAAYAASSPAAPSGPAQDDAGRLRGPES